MNFTSLQPSRVRSRTTGLVPAVCLAVGLAGCGGGGTSAGTVAETTIANLSAKPRAFWGREDQLLTGVLTYETSGPGSDSVFVVVQPPDHGALTVEPKSGAFTYEPSQDFFGDDFFLFKVRNDRGESNVAEVRLSITGVNDPPVLGDLADAQNSAEFKTIAYRLPVVDVDDEDLAIAVVADDPSIVLVEIDERARALHLEQRASGSTRIVVSVADAQASVSGEFTYTVGEVTKRRDLPSSEPSLVRITNKSDQSVSFQLGHNGSSIFRSLDEIVQHVEDLAPRSPEEPFERKLWRTVRDRTYQFAPLTVAPWLHDPLLLLNSIGWGFCDDVATVYARIGRAADYESRVWALHGHVVPEIFVGDGWAMYDPDLAVYYLNPDNRPASVLEIIGNPALVSDPIDPILAVDANPGVYSAYVAQIYADEPNEIAIWADAEQPPLSGEFVLPSYAVLTYPEALDGEVLGVDEGVSRPVPLVGQMKMELPEGWTGPVVMPLLLWAVNGTGRVVVDGVPFDAASPELTAHLRSLAEPTRNFEILESSSPMTLVFLVNPMVFNMGDSDVVEVTGSEVWSLDLATTPLNAGSVVTRSSAAAWRKPVPVPSPP